MGPQGPPGTGTGTGGLIPRILVLQNRTTNLHIWDNLAYPFLEYLKIGATIRILVRVPRIAQNRTNKSHIWDKQAYPFLEYPKIGSKCRMFGTA